MYTKQHAHPHGKNNNRNRSRRRLHTTTYIFIPLPLSSEKSPYMNLANVAQDVEYLEGHVVEVENMPSGPLFFSIFHMLLEIFEVSKRIQCSPDKFRGRIPPPEIPPQAFGPRTTTSCNYCVAPSCVVAR